MSKIKCFLCHKMGHYASKCPEKKKGKEKTQHVVATTKILKNEFTEKLEKEFSLISCLATITRSVWYLDSGASHHMMEAWERFSRLMEMDLEIHLELGDNAKYAVKGEGSVSF